MSNIIVKGVKTVDDNLYVTGVVDGKEVIGHGWVSRFNGLSNDGRKLHYLETLLKQASPVSITDQLMIEKYLHPALHWRIWRWMKSRSEFMFITGAIFILGQIAKHYFYIYLPNIEHLLHMK